ncbi:MAG: transposase [Bacteroidales bacterium]|nr:transposase [Bacteroidales bacterium]
MKTAKQIPGKVYPYCGKAENQIRHGKTASGTRRYMCLDCKKTYTIDPKRTRYFEETKTEAVEEYKSGISAREVARRHGMENGNVAHRLKKTARAPIKD